MILIAFLCVLLYGIYVKFIKPAFYWKRKGIFHVKPWARFSRVFLGNKSFFERVVDAYNEHPDRRYYGSYQFFKPSLIVRDLDLIKKITVKDFEYFPDHMNLTSEKSDPVLGLNLFSLRGEKWRGMRSTLSPAFTSSKMRSMYTLIQETAENFTKHFFEKDEEVIELEMKNIYSKYTNDVIANCAFGVTCDSMKDENNHFYSMGTTLTTPRGLNILRVIFVGLFPKLFEFFRIPTFPSHIINFFRQLIKETTEYREKENIIRPDMIHLLMEARKGRLKHDNEITQKDTGFATVEESSIGKTASNIEITDDVITAQALVFFFAGFDTTSTTLSFLSYELALQPDLQKKLHDEIDETLERNNGKMPYEELLKMKYLDQVISETLRKFPPGYILTRVCAKDYKIEATRDNETDFVFDEGCIVAIPVGGIHMDPEYFPEPHKFDPERFSDENKGRIVPGSYMPFGAGPRNCIGSRFALLEAKALVVTLFSKFEIIPTKNTRIPIKLAKSFTIGVMDGFKLGFKKRPKTL